MTSFIESSETYSEKSELRLVDLYSKKSPYVERIKELCVRYQISYCFLTSTDDLLEINVDYNRLVRLNKTGVFPELDLTNSMKVNVHKMLGESGHENDYRYFVR